MSSRFEERLRSGPPIVADGGMGALISGAVPRIALPRGGEPARARERRRAARELHPRRRRADRDEHVRRQPAQARGALPRGRVRADQLDRVRLAREAREVSGADVFIAGSIGPLGDVERFDAGRAEPCVREQAQLLEGRGVDLFMLETFFDLEELVAAIEAVRCVSSLPIVALMTFDADGQTLGGVLRRGGGRAARRARRRRRWREPQRRPGGRAERARGDATRRARARGAPERRPGEPRRLARDLPARDAGLLRRVRGAGAPARRRHHRRLLRHDAGADRRDPVRDRRGPRAGAPLVVRERELAEAAEAAPEETGSRGCSASRSSSSPSSSTRRSAATTAR